MKYTKNRVKCNDKLLLEAALNLAEMFGWCLIPVRGKTAACSWKQFQEKTPTTVQIMDMFRIPQITGFAVIHGEVSNRLVIRDFDKVSAYERWASKHRRLSKKLPTAKTGRGFHVYFNGPTDFVQMPDGEYRGTGKQYTLVPPSNHPDGGKYEWVISPEKEIPVIEDPVGVGLSIENLSIHFSVPPSHPQPLESSVLSGISGTTSSKIIKVDKKKVQEALNLVDKHLPTKEGQRHRKLFDLAQAVKGIDAPWTTPDLATVFNKWWAKARKVVRTKEKDLSFGEFLEAFELCRFAGGMDWDRLRQVSRGEDLPAEAECYPEKTQRLMQACIYLQRIYGDKPFFLSIKDAGKLMDATPETGRLAFRVMMRDGLLERVTEGDKVTGRASEYLCRGSAAQAAKRPLRAEEQP